MDTLNIVSLLVGFASLIYAVTQGAKNKKLNNYFRLEAWLLYDQSCEVLARMQDIDREFNSDNLDKEVIGKKIVETNCAGTQLLKDTVKNIKKTEKKFNKEIISKWFNDKRIPNESHIHVFERLIR